jgi:hypothetical protein
MTPGNRNDGTAGIDVFATARAAGLPIEVVRTEQCQQDYYALVLVE